MAGLVSGNSYWLDAAGVQTYTSGSTSASGMTEAEVGAWHEVAADAHARAEAKAKAEALEVARQRARGMYPNKMAEWVREVGLVPPSAIRGEETGMQWLDRRVNEMRVKL